MKKKKYDLLLLYSGGLDSSVLLRLALKMGMSVHCVLINYQQTHLVELEFAEKYCISNSVDYQIVEIQNLGISSKLTDKTIPYTGVSEWHVPGRNLMFVSIAASIAESLNIPLIWYGANYEDREHLFPDCYQEWIYTLNKLLSINGSKPIKLEAPLLGMEKNTVQKLAKLFNINENQIFSGYGKQ